MNEEQTARFKCKCCGGNQIDPRVVALHRAIEQDVLESVTVNSGYRCEKRNKKEGGSPTSSHVKGLAWDVDVSGSTMRYRIVKAALKLGIDRIGIGKGYIHLDIDRQKDHRVIWLY
jgi:uncharacterized protein YcbK (DUF882 family)